MDLIDIYIKQIRSVLELAVPAWHGGITQAEQIDIEQIQKCVAYIILGDNYVSYKESLKSLSLETLKSRRDKLCLNFVKKAEKHVKFRNWFKPAVYTQNTRQEKFRYCDVQAKHSRFKKSPLCFLTNRLNEYHNKK